MADDADELDLQAAQAAQPTPPSASPADELDLDTARKLTGSSSSPSARPDELTPDQAQTQGSIPQAIGTGVIEGVPFGRQIGAAVMPLLKKGLSYLPQNEDQKKALAGLPDTYAEGNQRALDAERTASAAHPLIQGASALGTGAMTLPVGAAATAGSAAIARAVPSAAKLAPIIAGGLTGAGAGALYGGSGGEGVFDPRGAAIGAGVGAVGGALADPIAAGLGRIGKGVSQWTGRYNPEQEAQRRIAQAYTTDQATGSKAMSPADFAAGQQANQPVVAGDMGGTAVRDLARSAANISPEARGALGATVGDRFDSQSDRTKGFIDQLYPGQNLNTVAQQDQIAAAARAANSPAYRAAYSAPNAGAIWSPTLANLMRSPDIQDAIGVAQRKAANYAVANNMPIPKNPFIQKGGNWTIRTDKNGNAVGIPSLRFWDQVKQAIDDKASSAKRAGNNSTARDVGGLNTILKGELDQQVPQYATARAGAAQFFGHESAVDGAVDFAKATGEPQVNAGIKQIQSLSPPDKEIFSRAFAAQLKQKTQTAADTADLSRQFSTPLLRTKMEAALNTPGSPDRATAMEAFVRRENMMNMLRQSVTGNSTTARQMADMQEQGHGGGLGHMIASQFSAPVAGGVTGAALGYHETPEGAEFPERLRNAFVGAVAGSIMGVAGKGRASASEATFNSIARQLASPDPAVYQKALAAAAKTPTIMQGLRQAELTIAAQASNRTGLSQ